MKAHVWFLGVVLSCGVAISLVGYVLPAPCWWAAWLGWGVVVMNSVVVKGIQVRAVGSHRFAFVGWGIIGNSIRMLTLVGIFAYITLFWKGERGSFLVSGLTSFFILMPIEVVQLFAIQNRSAKHD
jgi:hypothetical protein